MKWLFSAKTLQLISLLLLFISCVALELQLKGERSAHTLTKKELEQAIIERLQWQTIADFKELSITALQGSVQDCLRREHSASQDAAMRDAIMELAQPQLRSNDKEVIDDATRHKAAARLNRPLL